MNQKEDFNKRFKIAVERNFDQSAAIYDRFEAKHGLFADLTRRLCELNAPFAPERVLDVGCGSGISTVAIRESIRPAPILYAIDLSEAMLQKARERCREMQGVYFVRGDAERLSEYFHESFDAIFYTASIFLIPNYQESIAQAAKILLPGGVIAVSFYEGLFDREGNDAVAAAFPDQKYRYGAIQYGDLKVFMDRMAGLRTAEFEYRFEAARDFLFDFLSIPAQSAGLFPKVSYIKRIPMVREFCETLEERVWPVFMGWKFLSARKEG